MEKDQATCDHNCENCSVENCGSRGIEKLKPHELSKIKKTIAIISGKGGVGKSLVTTLVAVSLKNKGYKVGILDADVTGPSIPQAFGFKAYLCDGDENGIYPALTKNKMPIISSNLLLENPSAPLVWRGPMISNLVSQLYSQVIFGELDYLLIDMPPGTGDVPLTVFQQIPVDGCIVVSSPQDLVSLVVSKSVNMADEMHIPMLGLIENMAYVKCPHCGEKIDLFGEDKIQKIAAEYKLPLLAELPLDSSFRKLIDEGRAEDYHGHDFDKAVETIEKI